MRTHIILAVLACLLFPSMESACDAAEYRVRDLGWLGPGYTEVYAHAISDSGLILGSGVSSETGKAYAVWDREDNIVPLDRIGASISARDINSVGAVIGNTIIDGSSHAVLWNPTGGVTRVIGPGYWGSAINDFGQLLLSDTTGHLVLNPDSTSYHLDTLPGYRYSTPTAINEVGWAVGDTCDISYTRHATMWNSDGVPTILPMPSSSVASSAYAINDARQIAGYVSGNGWASPIVWNASGAFSLLPNLGGCSSSDARDINNSGWVVGTSSIEGVSQPVLWDENGNVTALPLLPGGGGGEAFAINNHGLIVGSAYDETGNSHAVLWTPVPEPSSLLALGAGGLGLLGAALKRRSRG